jgi:hypothetical protein
MLQGQNMIPLVFEYFQYRRLVGKYSNTNGPLLSHLFEDVLPTEVADRLEPGDSLYILSKRSLRAFIVSYYCHLPLSHIAMCIGDNEIIHATPDRGVVVQKLSSLNNRNLRFLPAKVRIPDEQRNSIRQTALSHAGRPYSYKVPIINWIHIITGRNWATFHWKFYLDFLILYLIGNVLFIILWESYMMMTLAALHFLVICYFAARWKYLPIPFNRGYTSFNMEFALMLNNMDLIFDEHIERSRRTRKDQL